MHILHCGRRQISMGVAADRAFIWFQGICNYHDDVTGNPAASSVDMTCIRHS